MIFSNYSDSDFIRFCTSFTSDALWLEEQQHETAHAANSGGDFIGILMMAIIPRIEQSRDATVIPSCVLPMGSPEVLNKPPIIY